MSFSPTSQLSATHSSGKYPILCFPPCSVFGRFNGTPTLSTPSGFTEDGLPLSIQFVGKHLSEPLLCQIGNAYEKLTGFTSAHPDV